MKKRRGRGRTHLSGGRVRGRGSRSHSCRGGRVGWKKGKGRGRSHQSGGRVRCGRGRG